MSDGKWGAMSAKAPPNHADLLKTAKRLDREEAAIKRRKLALAKQLIEAGRALGGDALVESAPAKKKRRVQRRRYAKRTIKPGPTSPEPAPRKGGRAPSETGWTGTMLRILTEANRPMAYAELKAEVMKTRLGPTLVRTDKAFYGGIAKLEERKQAVRQNGRIATVAAHERLMRDVAAGLAKEEPPIRNTGGERNSPAKSALIEILRREAEGASPADIVNELTPKLNLQSKNSKTAVYNLINRLVRRGELTKDGKNVRLPVEVSSAFQQSGTAVVH
jgi:hypothetical protein